MLVLFIINNSSRYTSNETYTWYKVVSIVNGETLKIKMNNTVKRVRLYGIDAPKCDKERYHIASAVLEEL